MVKGLVLEEPITLLKKDIEQMQISTTEVRFLVTGYYQLQDYRKMASGQWLQMQAAGEQAVLLEWMKEQTLVLEKQIKKALEIWTDNDPLSKWAKSITGIGPVISAGLKAHSPNIGDFQTVGHLWRFAGLDPSVEWKKGEKRPWNNDLKVLCWKIGESFVKTSNHPESFYGPLFVMRKEQEVARNDAGGNAETAARMLERKNFKAGTDARKAYEAGKLPPAHVHARAKRWVVKLFLSHWHQVGYEIANGVAPPKPYVITHMGHVDFVAPPNWPVQDG